MSIEYFIVFFSVFFLGYAAQKKRERIKQLNPAIEFNHKYDFYCFAIGIILIFFAGLRYCVGTDYVAYTKWDSSWSIVLKKIKHFDEPGLYIISAIFRDIYDSKYTLIFISSFITISLYNYIINRYSHNYFISIILYILMGEWQGSFNGIRQYLAASIIFWGHRLILEKNFFKYCLCILVASLFHKSAIVMIVPYFILRRKIDMRQIIFLALSACIILVSYKFIFGAISLGKGTELNLQYAYMTRSVNIFRILVCFVPIIIFYVFVKKDRLSDDEIFYINGFIFNAFAMLSAMGSAYLARIGIYTNTVNIIGYSYLFSMVKNENIKESIKYISLILFFLYWVYSISISGDLKTYHSILEIN